MRHFSDAVVDGNVDAGVGIVNSKPLYGAHGSGCFGVHLADE